jgi:hypothetical protein
MDILELARDSGMLVLLDARIGGEEYHSVSGSLQTLQRFAEAIRDSLGLVANQNSAFFKQPL